MKIYPSLLVITTLCAGLSAIALLGTKDTLADQQTEAVTMTSLDIIKSTYEGETSEENGANLQRHVAADVEWTEAAGFPYAGTYIGFDEIAKNVFHRLTTEWVGYKFEVEGYVADGDQVVAYGTYTGEHATTGRKFQARVAHLWKLEDGKIKRFEQFVDSKPVVDAMVSD